MKEKKKTRAAEDELWCLVWLKEKPELVFDYTGLNASKQEGKRMTFPAAALLIPPRSWWILANPTAQEPSRVQAAPWCCAEICYLKPRAVEKRWIFFLQKQKKTEGERQLPRCMWEESLHLTQDGTLNVLCLKTRLISQFNLVSKVRLERRIALLSPPAAHPHPPPAYQCHSSPKASWGGKRWGRDERRRRLNKVKLAAPQCLRHRPQISPIRQQLKPFVPLRV